MDDDVDMDAPSISTLPEEKTPPPRRRKPESSKKKQPKMSTPVALSLSWRKSGQSGQGSDGEQGEEGEDEEDQLIDDEDDIATPAATPSAKMSEAAPKKKAPAKRKTRKEPGAEDEAKKRPKITVKSRKLLAPGIEATPSESLSIDDGTDAGTGANTPTISVVDSEPQDQSTVSKPAKKKTTPRKSAPKAAKQQPSG
jgi:Wiskott-Aldrich syndrome protein